MNEAERLKVERRQRQDAACDCTGRQPRCKPTVPLVLCCLGHQLTLFGLVFVAFSPGAPDPLDLFFDIEV